MKFTEHMEKLCGELRVPQYNYLPHRKLIGPPIAKLKRENVVQKVSRLFYIAEMLQTNKEKLFALWLADQAPVSVPNKKGVANKVLNIVRQIQAARI
jgi:hypothetical protein